MNRTPVFRIGGGLPFCRSDELGELLGIDLSVVGNLSEEHDGQSDSENDKHDGQRPLAA